MKFTEHVIPVYVAYDPAVERGVLGLILAGGLAEAPTCAHFYVREHCVIIDAIGRLREAGSVVNLATVRAELLSHNELAKAGGGAALDGLTKDAPSSADAGAYLSLLRFYTMRRRLAVIGGLIVEMAHKHEDGEHFPRGEVLELLDRHDPGDEEVRQTHPPSCVNARALLEEEAEGVPWLVEGLLIAGGVNLLAGEVAAGKTYLALDLALAVADRSETSLAWDGRKCVHGPVLYYCLDSSPRTIRERVRGLCSGRGMAAPEDLWFEFAPLNLAKPEDVAEIGKAIQKRKAALVVLDVLARYMPGVDENTVAMVGPVMTALRQLATHTACSILLLHHFNKSAGYAASNSQGLRVRGSSDILGAVDAALTVSLDRRLSRYLTSGEDGKERMAHVPRRRILTPEKNREAPEEEALEFEIEAAKNGEVRVKFVAARPMDALPRQQQEVLEKLLAVLHKAGGEPLTRAELVERAGTLEIRSLNRMFAALKKRLDIQVGRRRKEFTYRMAETG